MGNASYSVVVYEHSDTGQSLLCGAAGFSRLVYSIFDNRLQEQHVMARRMCVAALLSYMTAMGFTLFGLLSA